MNAKTKEPTWKRLQRGQALVEYWPTLPAAVAVMIGAAIIVGFLNTSFLKTLNGLESYCKTSETTTTTAEMHNHRIEASAAVYDPVTNRTTVAFTVTSGSKPSISHWILGLPKGVAAHIIQWSEPWSWTDYDPTTGAAGVKFDNGYEADDEQEGGGKGKGKDKAGTSGIVLASYTRLVAAETSGGTAVRVISLTLDGNYQFGTITVTTKAGTDQVGVGQISGPIARLDDKSDDGGSGSGGGIDRSKGC